MNIEKNAKFYRIDEIAVSAKVLIDSARGGERKMTEEKMMRSCHHCCKKGHHLLFNLGIMALVYGVAKWIVVAYSLMPDFVWVLAGLLLLLAVWIKKSMRKGNVSCPECGENEHERHENN